VHADDASSIFQDAMKPSLSQLPRINLPKFSGVISEWEGFRNTFREMVDSNQGSGAAANLITNLAPSEDNYSTAWETLIDEYDDKRALIRTHAKAILCFPPMKTENLTELKRFRDTVATACSALANLGSPVEHLDHLLVSSMEWKLSPETAREWNKSLEKSKEFASYAQIHEFLTIWTRGCPDETKASDAVDSKARGRTRLSVNSVSVPTYVNCASFHHLTVCDDFLSKSIAQCSALVKKKQVSFNCLRSSHYTSKCPSKLRCVHCRRKHHSLLHLEVATVPTPVNQEPTIEDSN